MTERIKELAELATCDIKDIFGHWIGREFDIEKFAELVAAAERERIKEENQRCHVARGQA